MALGLEALGLAAPRFNQYMIDEVLLSADRELRDVLALGLVLLLLVQSALSQMRGWTIMYLTTHLNLQWVSDVFGRLVRLPMTWFEKRQLGDVLSRFGHLISKTERQPSWRFLCYEHTRYNIAFVAINIRRRQATVRAP